MKTITKHSINVGALLTLLEIKKKQFEEENDVKAKLQIAESTLQAFGMLTNQIYPGYSQWYQSMAKTDAAAWTKLTKRWWEFWK